MNYFYFDETDSYFYNLFKYNYIHIYIIFGMFIAVFYGVKSRGDSGLKKSVITLLLSLSLLSGVSLAASSASSSSLIETVLLPPNLIALSSLGAVPPAAPVEPEFSRINLNPRLVVLSSAQAILEPNFRLLRQAQGR